jgi:4'-phosphopantetheinyl transferase EntD
MPLFRVTVINKDCMWGLWEITESAEVLDAQLPPNGYDTLYLASVTHEGKKAESLAVRVLVKHLLQEWNYSYRGIIKDQHDKPYLAGLPVHLSISHTSRYAAVIVHRHQEVGIDIEFVKEKLLKVAHKFLNEHEWQDAGNDLQKLCVYWSAKEVLYKKYGRKQLSLKEEITIEPFKLKETGNIKGAVEKNGYSVQNEIIYMIIDNLIISFSFQ